MSLQERCWLSQCILVELLQPIICADAAYLSSMFHPHARIYTPTTSRHTSSRTQILHERRTLSHVNVPTNHIPSGHSPSYMTSLVIKRIIFSGMSYDAQVFSIACRKHLTLRIASVMSVCILLRNFVFTTFI